MGFVLVKTIDDGDCMFAAAGMAYFGNAYSVKHQKNLAINLRRQVTAYMSSPAAQGEFWAPKFRDGTVYAIDGFPSLLSSPRAFRKQRQMETYIAKMRRSGEWGGQLELEVLSRIMNRRIIVISMKRSVNRSQNTPLRARKYSSTPSLFNAQKVYRIVISGTPAPKKAIYIFHRDGNHYEALLNKLDPVPRPVTSPAAAPVSRPAPSPAAAPVSRSAPRPVTAPVPRLAPRQQPVRKMPVGAALLDRAVKNLPAPDQKRIFAAFRSAPVRETVEMFQSLFSRERKKMSESAPLAVLQAMYTIRGQQRLRVWTGIKHAVMSGSFGTYLRWLQAPRASQAF